MASSESLETSVEREVTAIKRKKLQIRSIAAGAGLLTGAVISGLTEKLRQTFPALFEEEFVPSFLSPEVTPYVFGISHGLVAYVAIEAIASVGRSAIPAVKMLMTKRGTPEHIVATRALVERVPDPIMKRVLDIRLHLLEGKVDEALEKYEQFLRVTSRYRPGWFVLEAISSRILDGLNYCDDVLRKKPADLSLLLDYAFYRWATGREKNARRYFTKAITQEGEIQPEVNCLYAIVLELMGDSEEARQQWRRTIDILLQRSDLQFQRIGDSRNEVLILPTRKFFKDKLVFKRGPEEIVKEFIITDMLYRGWRRMEETSEEQIKIVRPLHTTHHNGQNYYITKRRPLRNIEQLLETTEPIASSIQAMLDTEARIHAMATGVTIRMSNGVVGMMGVKGDDKVVMVPVYNHVSKLKQRLIDRCGETKEMNNLFGAYNLLVERLYPQQLVLIHGDATLANGLEDGTLLDFEAASLGMPTLDVVTTLEDHRLTNINRRAAWEYYLEKRAEYQKGRKDDRGMMDRWYEFHQAHLAMCQIGSQIHLGHPDRVRHHVTKALEYTREIDISLHETLLRYLRSTNSLRNVVS